MNKIKEIIKINKKTRQITYTELIRKKNHHQQCQNLYFKKCIN
jgi:hypothetical protein